MPFDFEEYEKECRVMSTEQLQLEWENYTRQIAGASTSTAASVLLSHVTMGISLVGVATSAPRLHNARKKREIIEARLAARGAVYDTRIRDVAVPMVVNGTVSAMTFGFFNPGGSTVAGIAVGRKQSTPAPSTEASTSLHSGEATNNDHPPQPGALQHADTWPNYEESKHGTDLPLQVSQSNHSIQFFDPSSQHQPDSKIQFHTQSIQSYSTTQSSVSQPSLYPYHSQSQLEPTEITSRSLDFMPVYGAMPSVPVTFNPVDEELRYLRARLSQLEFEKRNGGFQMSAPTAQEPEHVSIQLHDNAMPQYPLELYQDTSPHPPSLPDRTHTTPASYQPHLEDQIKQDSLPPPLPPRAQSVPEIHLEQRHNISSIEQPHHQASSIQRKKVGTSTRPPRPHSVIHQPNGQLSHFSDTPLPFHHEEPESYLHPPQERQGQSHNHHTGQSSHSSHAQVLHDLHEKEQQQQQSSVNNHHHVNQSEQFQSTFPKQNSEDNNLEQLYSQWNPAPQIFQQNQSQQQSYAPLEAAQQSYNPQSQPSQDQQRQDSGYYSATPTPYISSPSPTLPSTGIFTQSMPQPPPYVKPESGSAQDYFDQSSTVASSKLAKRKSRLDMGWDWSKEMLQGLTK